ncbi:MAG TPA: NAD(P)-dependent oxidoreductase, partial [Gemmatimonadales bacterium]|nr:NAD(P)-dependent oxidoreductase [Gemmatimonadales bacterium]
RAALPPVNVLVTGADGFVGQWLCRALLQAGHRVTGSCLADAPAPGILSATERAAVYWRRLDLADDATVAALAGEPQGQVVHLAGFASAGDAARDPGLAWVVNAAGTARLAHYLSLAAAPPLLLLVSSAEVYGAGEPRPRRETDPLVPRSAYAASKAAAELAAGEVARRTELRVVVARPVPHTGPGQTGTYAFPSFARRIREAGRQGAATVPVGNLEPVRELLDVRDVVDAYLALLARGVPGEAYNVARGEGVRVGEVFDRLARILGVAVRPMADPALLRTADLPHLVGDPAKIFAATGWRPRRTLDETLQDLVDAQAD